jgi:hypothetical protein
MVSSWCTEKKQLSENFGGMHMYYLFFEDDLQEFPREFWLYPIFALALPGKAYPVAFGFSSASL